MAYICNDCSYRGISSGQAGECPACGSFNLQVHDPQPDLEDRPKALWRLGLLMVLWTILLAMIARKLLT